MMILGIARAFNEELQPHPDMLRALFGKDEVPQHHSPWTKMAMVRMITSSLVWTPLSVLAAGSFYYKGTFS